MEPPLSEQCHSRHPSHLSSRLRSRPLSARWFAPQALTRQSHTCRRLSWQVLKGKSAKTSYDHCKCERVCYCDVTANLTVLSFSNALLMSSVISETLTLAILLHLITFIQPRSKSSKKKKKDIQLSFYGLRHLAIKLCCASKMSDKR